MRIKLSLGTLMFNFAWCIYLVSYIFMQQSEFRNMYDTEVFYKYIQLVVAIILFFKIVISDRFSFKIFSVYVLLVTIFFVNGLNIDSFFLLFNLIFVISSKGLNLKDFIKFDIILRLLILITILGLYVAGVLESFDRLINGSYKQSLGFYHPNTLGIFVTTILLEWIYIRYHKLKILDYMLIVFSLYIIDYYCSPRSSLYSLTIVLIITIILKAYPKLIFDNFIIRRIMMWLAPLCAGLSILVAYLYTPTNSFWVTLDLITTTRIRFANRFLHEYGLSLWGSPIETVSTRQALAFGGATNILDMAYVKLAINNGIIILIVYLIAYVLLQRYAIEKKDGALLICSSFFIILGLVEGYFYNISFNFTVLTLLTVVASKSKGVNSNNISLQQIGAKNKP